MNICHQPFISGDIIGMRCPECRHVNIAHQQDAPHTEFSCVVCELMEIRDELRDLAIAEANASRPQPPRPGDEQGVGEEREEQAREHE